MAAGASEPMVRASPEDDGVVVLGLSRPPVNALSLAMLEALDATLSPLAHDASIRSVVIASDGAQFSAGADLKELANLPAKDAPTIVRRGQAVFQRLAELPVPVIAAVHGLAVGGGFELALACDVRVADDSAKFGAPEVMHGLLPAWGGTQRLPRLIGPAKAAELIFSGALVTAPEALRIGLVNKVVPGGQDLRAARDLAHAIGQRAPRAVRAAKRAMAEGARLPLVDGLAVEAELLAREILPSRDLAEGLAAFGQRRPPRFTGE